MESLARRAPLGFALGAASVLGALLLAARHACRSRDRSQASSRHRG